MVTNVSSIKEIGQNDGKEGESGREWFTQILAALPGRRSWLHHRDPADVAAADVPAQLLCFFPVSPPLLR